MQEEEIKIEILKLMCRIYNINLEELIIDLWSMLSVLSRREGLNVIDFFRAGSRDVEARREIRGNALRIKNPVGFDEFT